MPISWIPPFVAIVVLFWTFTGAPPDTYGQLGGTPALESAEASLELNRSERRRIQRGLAADGFDPGPADGLFGRGTREAIRKWQESRGEGATGYLNADTARALLAAGKPQSGSAKGGAPDPSKEILRDKYIMGLSKALKKDDYPKALELIGKLEKIGNDLPPSIEYFRGEAYFHTGRYVDARQALNRYFAKTGRKGRYYKKSLEFMLVAEEKILTDRDKHGNTWLARVIAKGRYEAAREFIALGADVNAKSKRGYTPLHSAASKNATAVAVLLLKHGADVNAKSKRGYTPLHSAASKNATAVAVLLLKHGADVNAKNKDGSSPLHHAAWKTARDLAVLLLKHGADVNAKNKYGSSPLHRAAGSNARDVAALLLKHGADVNAKNKDGRSPLHRAAGSNARDVAALLLKHGADVNAKDKYGRPPLNLAIGGGNDVFSTAVARLLLEQGADVNAILCITWFTGEKKAFLRRYGWRC